MAAGLPPDSIIETGDDKVNLSVLSKDPCVGPFPADDGLSDGEIDEPAVKKPNVQWNPSLQLHREVQEAQTRDRIPPVVSTHRQPPRGPRKEQQFNRQPPQGPRRQQPFHLEPPRGPRQQHVTVRPGFVEPSEKPS
ncbi:hypothetical protein CLCR_09233 [Cladophialophora carrionii]|uniref:Uncharacterized protein n=1 Tax=Cladophialophora carrionii TaxID=86049 RepID=A0A1C1CTR8_9EURO|nr:hypothetical protein CLCR_09233 [Cladophialophora carrionii]